MGEGIRYMRCAHLIAQEVIIQQTDGDSLRYHPCRLKRAMGLEDTTCAYSIEESKIWFLNYMVNIAERCPLHATDEAEAEMMRIVAPYLGMHWESMASERGAEFGRELVEKTKHLRGKIRD